MAVSDLEGGVLAAVLAAATALGALGREVVGWLKGWREAVKSDAEIARELRDELRKEIAELRDRLDEERRSCDERIEAQEKMIGALRALVYALATRTPLDAKMRDLMAEIAPTAAAHA